MLIDSGAVTQYTLCQWTNINGIDGSSLSSRYVPDGGPANGLDEDKDQKARGRKGSSPGQDLIEKYSAARGKAPKKVVNMDSKVLPNQRYAPPAQIIMPSSIRLGLTTNRHDLLIGQLYLQSLIENPHQILSSEDCRPWCLSKAYTRSLQARAGRHLETHCLLHDLSSGAVASRGMARPISSLRRGAPAGRSRGQALPARGKGRVGRGLNEAAEALLGMCVDAEEETPQVNIVHGCGKP